MVNLYRIILPVRNIEIAAQFYAHILGLPGERVSPGRHYFNCDSTILACYDPVADGDDADDGWQFHYNQYIYFAVPDLAETEKRVHEMGGKSDSKIAVMPWGERLFYAKDPFDNPICFVDQETLFRGTD